MCHVSAEPAPACLGFWRRSTSSSCWGRAVLAASMSAECRQAVRVVHAWHCREAVGTCPCQGHANAAARPAAPTFLLLPFAWLLLRSSCSPPSGGHLRLVMGPCKHCFLVLHLPLPAQLLLMDHPISLQQLLGHRLHLLLLHCPDLHHQGGLTAWACSSVAILFGKEGVASLAQDMQHSLLSSTEYLGPPAVQQCSQRQPTSWNLFRSAC